MARLTARFVANTTKPGHYVDGDGLAMVIGKRGGKSWILRTMVRGKRRDIGLGGVSYVSLAEAREKARELRRLARTGGDPLAIQRTIHACPTFEEAARKVHAEQIVGTSKNDKHRAQWINTLRDYAFPIIGAKPVSDILQSDVLAVLSPIWLSKQETARRVRQRIRTVLDWARTAGHRDGVNPVEGVERGLARQRERVKHHAALPYRDVPQFLTLIGENVASQALKFLVLTAARTGEVIGARWSEIDFDERVWIVPEERMKASREHRVPLSEMAVEILGNMAGVDDDFVFPGQKRGKGLSNMAMSNLLKRLGYSDITVHGFRSSFRDWAEEQGGMPREVAELCLAHEVGNAVERAYLRTDLFARRRTLLDDWSAFCMQLKDE